MGAIRHSGIDVDGVAGPAHVPRILLLHGCPSSSSTGRFALAPAAGEIAQFVGRFLGNTTQNHRRSSAEPRV